MDQKMVLLCLSVTTDWLVKARTKIHFLKYLSFFSPSLPRFRECGCLAGMQGIENAQPQIECLTVYLESC